MKRIIMFITLMSTAVFAAEIGTQFTLCDINAEWTGSTFARQSRGELTQPDDWRKPLDFLDGEHYTRIEIIDKPTDIEVMAMYCYWQNWDLENCTRFDKVLSFSTEGVYYKLLPNFFSSSWLRKSHKTSPADKTIYNGPINAVLVQWFASPCDGCSKKVLRTGSGHEDFGPDATKHIPIKFRAEIVVVAKGEVFVPPSHWSGYPSTWNIAPTQSRSAARRGGYDRQPTLIFQQTAPGTLRIALAAGADCGLVSVATVLGKTVVPEHFLNAANNEITIDALPKGIYAVSIKTASTTRSRIACVK